MKRLFSTFSNIFCYILQFIYIVGIRLINILKEFCDQKIKEISNNSIYFLEEATPILINEWQEIPEIWYLIRLEVDKRNKNRQFILTGSKTPDTTKIHHSGIGRINKIKMSTLSLFESNESSGKISLSKILNNEQNNYFFTSEKNMNDIAFFLCIGGWPNIISQQLENSKALKLANLYYSNLISYNLDNFFDKKRSKTNWSNYKSLCT